MKRIISFLLALTLLISLCACGKQGTVSDSDAADIEYLPDVFAELRPVEDFATVGANVVNNPGFDSTDLLWSLYEESGGSANTAIKNQEFAIDIADGGKVSHAVQVYYDGIKLHQYAKYTFSFDASCTMPGKILEARIQYNGGDYHAYTMIFPELTENMEHYSIDFTMDYETDIAPRICFNMGRALDGSEADADLTNYSIRLDNISVVCNDNSMVEIEVEDVAKDININQIGYLPNASKTAIFRGNMVIDSFDVVNADGEVVYTGEITGPTKNYSSYEYNWYGDFSAVTEPGTYKIVAKEFGESYSFEIGNDIYKDAFNDIVHMFYMQRCGCELPAKHAGDFAHASCHDTPARIYGTDTFIEVNGGWHDAGDYGRYISPAAKAVADLLLAYKAAPDMFGDDSNIPESGNGIPDILDEVRYELEWMLKMQNDEGGVYHKVTCANFPGNVMPEEETEELIVCPVSKTATYGFAASMAMASKVYADVDADFAKTCFDAAMKAWTFAENVGPLDAFKNPEDILTGEYGDTIYGDEQFWAACELLSITGIKEDYEAVISKRIKPKVSTGFGWTDIGAYGVITYLTMDESYTDPTVRTAIQNTFIKQADTIAEKSVNDGYHISLGNEGYVWGSNMSVANNAMLLLLAQDLGASGNDYEYYANEHMNYLFGANPVSYCFVTGHGTVAPENTHHRPSIALGKTLPGMLVGGPNSGLEDPFAMSALSTAAPACCYIDNTNAYSLNEITIYWNSPLVYLMARMCAAE